jgi:hypothetical protein
MKAVAVLALLCVVAQAYINLDDRPVWQSEIEELDFDPAEIIEHYQSINITQRELNQMMREFDYDDADIPKGKTEYSYWEVRQHLQSIPLPYQGVDGEASSRVPKGGWIPICYCIGLKENHNRCSPLGITMFKNAVSLDKWLNSWLADYVCAFSDCGFPDYDSELGGYPTDSDSNTPDFNPGHAWTGGDNLPGNGNKFLGSWCIIDDDESPCSTAYAQANCPPAKFNIDQGNCRLSEGYDCAWCTTCGGDTDCQTGTDTNGRKCPIKELSG